MGRLKLKQQQPPRKIKWIGVPKVSERVSVPLKQHYQMKIIARRLLTFDYLIGRRPDEKKNYKTYQPRVQNFDWSNDMSKDAVRGQATIRKYLSGIGRPYQVKSDGAVAVVGVKRKLSDDDPETSEESTQRTKFAKRMRQDATSPEVYEVIRASRAAAVNRENGAQQVQANTTVYLESLRSAVNKHDFLLSCKALEGLCEVWHFCMPTSLIFEGALQATVNLFKDNVRKFKDLMEVLKRFVVHGPQKIGIAAATWLTQKGAFMDGYNFLKSQEERGSSSLRMATYNTIKLRKFEFINNLFEAVYHYSCYKRDMKVLDADNSHDLDASGYNALNHFERLLQQCNELDFDVTIFIEPLIELLVKFKSKKVAKEVFTYVCNRNFGNGVLDELYIKFLRKYFPKKKKELQRKENDFVRFQFEIRKKENVYHQQILKRFLEKKSVDNTQVPFKQIKKPSFCL